jgi:hypothetical protein
MYYSYVEIEYVAMNFSPARTNLAVKLLNIICYNTICSMCCLGGIFCHHSLSAILIEKIGKPMEEI